MRDPRSEVGGHDDGVIRVPGWRCLRRAAPASDVASTSSTSPLVVGERLDQLVVLAGQPADLLEEGDVFLSAPHQRDVGQVAQRPFAGLAPDGAGRRHRLEDHGGGDPQATQLGDQLGRSPSGAMLAHSSSMSTKGDSSRRVAEAAAWWRAVSTTSSMRAATIGATECCAPGEPIR